ncbi:hypothetical protein BC936DRAFT_149093 [Jimgerdemannia flammicorona]|uniref:MACPF-like domain-containing protein n=1 Tax=Jimgerdemannia flammicorona TaxID=994334 RepID=A0A433D1K3_9FUNG|nr:hypothetical protein BC936DRAFT_149093 [Jimgerdemannia flammicorona]
MNGQSISTSHYEDSDIRSIFERNRAYTITGKAALTAGIRPREGASLSLLACNEIREEELVSRSELTKSLIDNGFNQASVTFLVPVITTELGGSRTLVDMSVRSDYKSSYYRVIYYYKASMQLTKSFVEPTPEFVSEVRAALTPPNTLDKYKALLGVFQKFGYVWAQKVTVGGRITVSEIISEHQSDREKKFNAFAEAKASVNGTITGFGKAGFGAGFTTQTDQGSINAADFSNQRNRVRIIGGRPTSATLDDRTSWEKSLQHEPSTWEVILREDLIPICELLDDDLLAQVVNVMEDTLKVERITSEIKLNMRNVKTKFSYDSWPLRVKTQRGSHAGYESDSTGRWRFRPVGGHSDMKRKT